MIEERARVIAVDGSRAIVVVDRRSACGQCASGGGCGSALLSAWINRRQVTFSLPDDAGAAVGDHLVLGLDERDIQHGAVLLYAVPLFGLLGGAVAGHQLAPLAGLSQELVSILLGLSGLAGALAWTRRRSRKIADDVQHRVRILRIDPKPSWNSIDSLMARAPDTNRR